MPALRKKVSTSMNMEKVATTDEYKYLVIDYLDYETPGFLEPQITLITRILGFNGGISQI